MKKSGGNKYFEGENLFVKNKQTNKQKNREGNWAENESKSFEKNLILHLQ